MRYINKKRKKHPSHGARATPPPTESGDTSRVRNVDQTSHRMVDLISSYGAYGSNLCLNLTYRLLRRHGQHICNKGKSCFFRPVGCFRSGVARPISAPLGSADGESPEGPPPASIALVLAPWPAQRAPKVEKFEVSFAGDPSRSAVPSRLRETRSAIRHSRKKGQSIPYSFPMKNDLP